MARKKTKTAVDKEIKSPVSDNVSEKYYVVELYDKRSKTRSFLADKLSGSMAQFKYKSDAEIATREFLKLINGAISYSYSIKENSQI